MKSRLKLYLPISQVSLALMLGFWGNEQTHRLWTKFGTDHVWDYVAPPEMVMHLINLPATLICSLMLKQSFQIGIEYSKGVFIMYVFLIAVLWFLVSWCVQDYPRLLRSRPAAAIALRAFGVLTGILMLGLGALLLKTRWPWSVLFPLGMILWGCAIILLFTWKRPPELETTATQ